MSEILAPAGDKISAISAINAGADAIYLGLKEFSARSFAENFDVQDLKEIADYAHAMNVKVYVAMNTLVKQNEVEGFLDGVLSAWNNGADAIIISDVFLGEFIKKNYPEIVLHLSTQAGVCNAYGARFAKNMGFSRVILARETKIEDISEIAKIIETEVFVQGALCTCFSGQCYFSSFAGGNSGNRGKCKQPCRKKYTVDGNGDYSYRLSLSDLSIGHKIEDLQALGVASFKIEGRMRRPEYVASAVRYYRRILDGCEGASDFSDLKRAYNRGNYTLGLGWGQDKTLISSAVQGHIGEFVGLIKVENGKFICKTRVKCTKGDCFKILRDGKEIGGAIYAGQAKDGFELSGKVRLKTGDKAFITTDSTLTERVLSSSKLRNITVNGRFMRGERPIICVDGVEFSGDFELSEAKDKPLTRVDFENCFKKTDKYPFLPTFGEFETDGVFVRISDLNALRRNVHQRYFEILSHSNNVKYQKNHVLPTVTHGKNGKIAVIGTNLSGLSAEIGILKLNDYNCNPASLLKGFRGEKYLYLPPYLTGLEIQKIKPLTEKFDGIYCEGLYGFELAKELNKPLFAGCGLNISNSISVFGLNAKYYVTSKELTLEETKDISAENSFYLTGGNIKVMDLIYCPFGKKCVNCENKDLYALTDENGRKFPLRRYKISECRFEVYNCSELVVQSGKYGALLDCTLIDSPQSVIEICDSAEKMRTFFKNYTNGHSVSSVK